jgi:putative colanic acid biosynthesis UDP-glucose lipid carrier transferase
MIVKHEMYSQYFPLKNNAFYSFVKRVIDIFVSAVMLVIIFPPLFLVVCFVNLLSSSHRYPVFFCQKRTGFHGKTFNCYKFRSMKTSSIYAKTDNERVSHFGSFMRKYSLDEVPQFFNVFIGNMSLVGPRPHMLRHTLLYAPLVADYESRHAVKPGLTGYAQVLGCRGELRELRFMEERIASDLQYIRHRSTWLDLKIIFLTPICIFKKIKPFL